ncbi:geranylgeranylglycerol-phosphate geranylgeranyltransferase [Aquimarina sp. 2201CG14-23]|uniref:geranylgeranylglycerol-phosphate geranylgeranyltransferase n=1 Tax=Aquimarina mycalae TaxID=3040073 RepID=UPI002478039F|nr:geranylgeranylglycerol-phosphate geranylgeranyltransferase [Aquimarina sp. 2201CG14-23]MDH7446681.1 geranylgeranylglycerol-phosphate geranylgeranyltransferase [Aquimarina sp. 2201CG14-23]
MQGYLKLIKFDNLILIAIAQLCIKYGLFEPFDIDITLNGFGIFLLIISTISLVAAENVMLEIQDKEHPNAKGLMNGILSEKVANRLFIIFNVIGVCIGFYLSNIIGKPKLAALFIVVSGIFYIYATHLKEILVLKNVLVGIMMALGLIAVGIFDLLPAITEKNLASQKVIFLIIVDYSFFAFIVVTIREIVKDCLMIDKDHNAGIRTIPIVLGKDRTTKLISGLTIIPIALIIYYVYTYLFSNSVAVVLVLGILVAPLLYFMFKSWNAETNKDFKTLSLILKLVLFLASLSLLLYQFILK